MKKLLAIVLALMMLLTALPGCSAEDTSFDPELTVAVLGTETVSAIYEEDTYAALASILLLIDYIGSPAGAADQLDNYSLTDVFVGICALDDGTEVFNVFFPGPDAERALGIMMIPDPGVANYAYYPLEGVSASLYNTFLDTLLSDVCNTHKQIPVEDMSTAITLVLNALEE